MPARPVEVDGRAQDVLEDGAAERRVHDVALRAVRSPKSKGGTPKRLSRTPRSKGGTPKRAVATPPFGGMDISPTLAAAPASPPAVGSGIRESTRLRIAVDELKERLRSAEAQCLAMARTDASCADPASKLSRSVRAYRMTVKKLRRSCPHKIRRLLRSCPARLPKPRLPKPPELACAIC